MLRLVQPLLSDSQKCLIVGGFEGESKGKAFEICSHSVWYENPIFTGNHKEKDSRIWLHAIKTNCEFHLSYT